MSEDIELKCAVCQKSQNEVPIVNLTFKNKKLGICSQHMPVLIHHPQELIATLESAQGPTSS